MELERSKTSASVTPESIASRAIEGLVIGSTEDKRDTFTMLFGGAFVLLTGGGFLFDYFVLRRAGEKIEKVKSKVNDKVEKVKESKDKFTSKIDENVEKVKEKKDKLTNMIDEKVDKARETKEKLKGYSNEIDLMYCYIYINVFSSPPFSPLPPLQTPAPSVPDQL